MKVIIIEDELAAADALKDMLREVEPGIDILAVLQSIEESVQWLRDNQQPDMVFMDIHLADGSSFAIFESVEIRSPVVFTTAYDEYALRAFETSSIDYLLKPISTTSLRRALDKFRSLVQPAGNAEIRQLVSILGRDRHYRSSFLIPEKDRLIPLTTDNIAYIYIEERIVRAVTYDGQAHLMNETLDQLTELLDPDCFFRANRQFIIARKAVKDLSVWFGSKLTVNLTVPVSGKIVVSKSRVPVLREWLLH